MSSATLTSIATNRYLERSMTRLADRDSTSHEASRTPRRNWLQRLASEFRSMGRTGLISVVALAVAAALTVAMGFTITRTSRDHLLMARTDMIESDVSDLPAADRAGSDPQAFTLFTAAIDDRLHGTEIERVKVWGNDGHILHSDDPNLVGQQFDLMAPAREAFAGRTSTYISDLGDPAHASDRDLGQLIEVYVPVVDGSGSVTLVVEVEQRLDSLNAALVHIRRNVWLSITIGVGALAVFLFAVALGLNRAAERRRRQAEVLLGAAFRAQDEERQRIVGSLHDDVGQPLYRLLYGIEGSRAKIDPDHPVARELDDLGDLVRSIDSTLRAELEHLHYGSAADVGLVNAIEDLARTTRQETDLRVVLDLGSEPKGLTKVELTALYRAVQEAVVNTRKHAQATTVTISLRAGTGRIQATVVDDGSGSAAARGLGLTTASERLDALGGGLSIKSKPNAGTRLTAWLPLGVSS